MDVIGVRLRKFVDSLSNHKHTHIHIHICTGKTTLSISFLYVFIDSMADCLDWSCECIGTWMEYEYV